MTLLWQFLFFEAKERMAAKKLCPCGTGKLYSECCRPLHDGALPPDALALMRSRYSAYVLHKAPYIIRTTHPQNSTYQEDKKKWTREILLFCLHTRFQKLEILEFIPGESEAFVTFKVSLLQKNEDLSFQEKSRFLKEGEQWLYYAAVKT